mmetsp:Transcript_37418/g.36004  ORF Transcript_37418/g.36004 Transcript_37418/m.36004 type:complete len:97 (-) Transcript_37418:153-443(-)
MFKQGSFINGESFQKIAPLNCSHYSTPFYLAPENENKYKVPDVVEKTVDFTNMIPFLRSNEDIKVKRKNKSQSQLVNMEGDSRSRLHLSKQIGRGS